MSNQLPDNGTYNGVTAAMAGAGMYFDLWWQGYLQKKAADDAQKAASAPAVPPPPANSTVSGLDGIFVVTLVPPSDTPADGFGSTVFYQLQSCATLDFDSAHGVTTYGGDAGLAQTEWRISDPQVSKYFRWRTRFQNSNWTDWTYYSSVSACGPIRVDSNGVRSTSLNPNVGVNNTNFATVDSIDAGASATIRVYGTGGVGTTWTRVVGSVTEGPFPAGTITGKAYATHYYVLLNSDQTTYSVVTAFPDTLPDGYRFAGAVTTVGAGGGVGPAGGGGSGGSSGGRYANTL